MKQGTGKFVTETTTKRAADHFGIPESEVQDKHKEFIRAQDYVKYFGYTRAMEVGRRYTVDESGVVEFLDLN